MSSCPTQLAPKTYQADAEFASVMHGDNPDQSGYLAVLKKNKDAHTIAINEYFKHWSGKPAENVKENEDRLGAYAELTKQYYNLCTDFYEFGWGGSFHFSRYYKGEGFKAAAARHEHYIAFKIGITEGMNVLDVGCGVGGPAREIARFTGANVVGLNNNDYQLQKARCYASRDSLSDKVSFIKSDFMQMDIEDSTFDAVYAIEATCHAPSFEGVYSEIYRVLKPGGKFGVYEWVLTENYDETNELHRQIVYGIEVGDGIPKMFSHKVAEKALIDVGFELELAQDMANMDDQVPWYAPLSGDWSYVRSLGDLFTFFRASRVGRFATMEGTGVLEKIGVAPKGSKKVTEALEDAALNLVQGAKLGIFTPMMLYIVKKPEN